MHTVTTGKTGGRFIYYIVITSKERYCRYGITNGIPKNINDAGST